MHRKRFLWKLRGRELQLGDRTLIMGVLNLTPDSFSDGGRFDDPDRGYAHALELEQQGADILDIGAESMRPGATPISEEEESRRLIPVLKRLRDKLAIPISVDTYKSGIAERAIELGAEIINDPTGLTFDPRMVKVVAEKDAGLVLNHMRGTPQTWAKLPSLSDPMGTVLQDLRAALHRAYKSGVDPKRVVVDPGLGFGKRKDENSALLAQLHRLASLEVAVASGPSRKSFLNQTESKGLLMATAAAVTASILEGAHIVRVHDVAEMVPVIQVADAILRAAAEVSQGAV